MLDRFSPSVVFILFLPALSLKIKYFYSSILIYTHSILQAINYKLQTKV